MDFGDPHNLSAFTLGDLPHRRRHVLLTPAARWRVVLEQLEPIANDIILETVLRIRAAGGTSPSNIADLLQLPEDLIRHLLAQAATHKLDVTSDGQLRATTLKVAWVYRDLATGELWPDPAPELPPVPITFISRFRAQFERGTAGRPYTVECRLLDTRERGVAEPTSIELARFSRASGDPRRRTAVVSSGEPCLVASSVVALPMGYAVETSRGVPHLSLTQHLERAREQHPSVRTWLSTVPKAARTAGTELPLEMAVTELRAFFGERIDIPNRCDVEDIVSRVELCLSRFTDQFQYMKHIDIADHVDTTDWRTIAARYAIDPPSVALLSSTERGTLPYKIFRLLLASRGEPERSIDILKLAGRATAQWASIVNKIEAENSLSHLVRDTIFLCELLLQEAEEVNVGQVG